MGVIPRGTANAFAVALGIPTHIDDPQNFAVQAAEVILQVRQAGRQVTWQCHAPEAVGLLNATLPTARRVCMSSLSI